MNMKLWCMVGFLSLTSVAQATLYGWEGRTQPSGPGWVLMELDIPASLRFFPQGWVIHFHEVVECVHLPESNDEAPPFVRLTNDTLWVKDKEDNVYKQLTFDVYMATLDDCESKEMRVLTGRKHSDVILNDYTLERDVVKLFFIQNLFEGLLTELKPDFETSRKEAECLTGWYLLGINSAVAMEGGSMAYLPTKFSPEETLPLFLNPLHDKDLPECVYLTADKTFWAKSICGSRYVQLVLDERSMEDGSIVLLVTAGEHAHQGKIVCDCDTSPTSAQNGFVETQLQKLFEGLTSRRK